MEVSALNDDEKELALATRIEAALKAASVGSIEILKDFYKLVLNSILYVPAVETKHAKKMLEIGQDNFENLGLVVVDVDGKKVLPCFTRIELLKAWTDREEPLAIKKQFVTLLTLCNEEVWLHLNPGDEWGKEFSPWEISLLRQGEDSIADIIQELKEEENSEIEVKFAGEEYDDLRHRLRIVFEAYTEVEEAFLVEVDYGDDTQPKPLLGLVLSEVGESRKQSLGEEIDMCARNSLDPYREVMLVLDLANTQSPNWGMLEERTPFYIKQVSSKTKNEGNSRIFSWSDFRQKFLERGK